MTQPSSQSYVQGVCDKCNEPAFDLKEVEDFDGVEWRPQMICGPCVEFMNDSARDELKDSGFFDPI